MYNQWIQNIIHMQMFAYKMTFIDYSDFHLYITLYVLVYYNASLTYRLLWNLTKDNAHLSYINPALVQCCDFSICIPMNIFQIRLWRNLSPQKRGNQITELKFTQHFNMTYHESAFFDKDISQCFDMWNFDPILWCHPTSFCHTLNECYLGMFVYNTYNPVVLKKKLLLKIPLANPLVNL